MSKKLLLVALAILFVAGIVVNADAGTTKQPAYENCIILDGTGDITHPPCIIKRVRYGMMGATKTAPSLNSGDVVMWDTTSADGVTVSACIATTDAPCGVLVTDLLTDDTAGFSNADNFGYMAVGGVCRANIDTSEATAGQVLCITEQVTASLPYFGTQNNFSTNSWMSKDVGTLLNDPGADGGGMVWLNLN